MQQYASSCTMERLIANKTMFKIYKVCRYASDLTFQQTFRPGGTLEESKNIFLVNTNCTGLKLRHLLCLTDWSCTQEGVTQAAMDWKSDIRKTITDIRPSRDQSSGYWRVILDRGYTGIEADVRCVILRKKPVGGVLTVEDRRENEAKASDRVIVENYVGRQGILCGAVSNTYRWSEDSYDNISS